MIINIKDKIEPRQCKCDGVPCDHMVFEGVVGRASLGELHLTTKDGPAIIRGVHPAFGPYVDTGLRVRVSACGELADDGAFVVKGGMGLKWLPAEVSQ